ncbi:hypothetical protein PROFUN_04983 [Planoprotostelium fungivorum]|uniref:Uncharacterized protein n=1 Tax=Planoprotostelium fungivorum TaxID=1890364 RepID=A0A2P6NSR6_9EUKA|nr:hypothetical protein PROFUN_04983 [Planoprotostelium fungivorum]
MRSDRPRGGPQQPHPTRFSFNNRQQLLNITRLQSFASTLTPLQIRGLIPNDKPQPSPKTVLDTGSPPPSLYEEDLRPTLAPGGQKPPEELISIMQNIIGPSISVEELTILLLGAGNDVQIALNHWAQRQESRESSGSTSPSIDEVSALERVISEVGEEIECSLCLAYFDNPISLDCLHSFCSSCVERIADDDSVTCPTCSVVTPLEDGITSLAQNRYLANIVDMIKNAPMRKCGGCQKTSISAFCKNCRQFLCADCNQEIHSEPSKKRHRVRKFGPEKRSPVSCIEETSSDSVELKKRIEYDSCQPMFQEWIDGLWMTPFRFKQSISTEKFRLLYLPYYHFQVSATVHCRYEYLMEDYSSTVRVRWQQKAESSHQNVDFFVPAYGLDGLPGRDFFEPIDPTSISECEASLNEATDIYPFRVDVHEAWESHWREKMNFDQEERCKRQTGGRIRSFQMTSHVHEKSSRRVFLPVYMCTYRYLGIDYYFAINAATGAVNGERPHSTLKPMLTGLSILQCIAVLHRFVVESVGPVKLHDACSTDTMLKKSKNTPDFQPVRDPLFIFASFLASSQSPPPIQHPPLHEIARTSSSSRMIPIKRFRKEKIESLTPPSFEIEGKKLRIGRNDLSKDDRRISRKHLVIRVEDGIAFARSVGTNTCYISKAGGIQKQMAKSVKQEVQPGDTIYLLKEEYPVQIERRSGGAEHNEMSSTQNSVIDSGSEIMDSEEDSPGNTTVMLGSGNHTPRSPLSNARLSPNLDANAAAYQLIQKMDRSRTMDRDDEVESEASGYSDDDHSDDDDFATKFSRLRKRVEAELEQCSEAADQMEKLAERIAMFHSGVQLRKELLCSTSKLSTLSIDTLKLEMQVIERDRSMSVHQEYKPDPVAILMRNTSLSPRMMASDGSVGAPAITKEQMQRRDATSLPPPTGEAVIFHIPIFLGVFLTVHPAVAQQTSHPEIKRGRAPSMGVKKSSGLRAWSQAHFNTARPKARPKSVEFSHSVVD